MGKPVILTGLRANNELHLGNYLGALLPIVKLQRKYAGEYQINLFVPDLHSFTTPIDHSRLQAQIQETLRHFVAAGLDLDDKDTFLYRQSYIPAHSELTVILNSFTYMGEMSRMTQFKEKSAALDSVSIGLFDYPVLMASDILLYGAKYVPVGDDQTQHVEIARDIALRVNKKFGKDVLVPPADLKEQLKFIAENKRLRIKDLLDPSKKMSKSNPSPGGIIFLNDTPEQAKKKIMGATTDSVGKVQYDPKNQPGISNLLEVYSHIKGESIELVLKQFNSATKYSDFKEAVADAVSDFLQEYQGKLAEVDEAKLREKLHGCEVKMNEQAKQTLLRVQKAVGLR